jgi:amidophosphoribosyltransferase
MIAATNQAPERLCTACFTGSYPVPLPEEDKLGKSLFELEVPVDVVAEAVARP